MLTPIYPHQRLQQLHPYNIATLCTCGCFRSVETATQINHGYSRNGSNLELHVSPFRIQSNIWGFPLGLLTPVPQLTKEIIELSDLVVIMEPWMEEDILSHEPSPKPEIVCLYIPQISKPEDFFNLKTRISQARSKRLTPVLESKGFKAYSY